MTSFCVEAKSESVAWLASISWASSSKIQAIQFSANFKRTKLTFSLEASRTVSLSHGCGRLIRFDRRTSSLCRRSTMERLWKRSTSVRTFWSLVRRSSSVTCWQSSWSAASVCFSTPCLCPASTRATRLSCLEQTSVAEENPPNRVLITFWPFS